MFKFQFKLVLESSRIQFQTSFELILLVLLVHKLGFGKKANLTQHKISNKNIFAGIFRKNSLLPIKEGN